MALEERTHPVRGQGYRRLAARYERSARRFAGFLSLAATLVCFKQLAELTV
jgi:hypothetical protein